MANDIELPQDFKTAMREKILTAVMGFIPAEKVESMIQAEINAFFTDEKKLAFSNGSYGSRYEIETAMTPFRQMVWSELVKVIRPALEESIKSKTDALKAAVALYLTEVDPKIAQGTQTAVDHMVRIASASMLTNAMTYAIGASHESIARGLRDSGFPNVGFPMPVIPTF